MLRKSLEVQPATEAWPHGYAGDRPFAAVPQAAAQGILLAVMLSSVFWIGLSVSLWTLCDLTG